MAVSAAAVVAKFVHSRLLVHERRVVPSSASSSVTSSGRDTSPVVSKIILAPST